MKIILKQDIDNLGSCWEIKEVADGYARNYLFQKGFAVEATDGNIKMIDVFRAQQAAKVKRARKEIDQLKEKIEGLSCTIPVKVGDDDKLFGSVTSGNIAEVLSKNGIEIDKRKISLEEPIKALGIYNVPIKLGQELTAELKVWIVKE